MQLTGTIQNIESNGYYNSQQGQRINTFLMTISTGNGLATGEIGSIQEIYPANPGDQITVEMKDTNHGTKFKKINPQYQQGQQQGQQGNQQRRQQPKDDVRGKCRCQVVTGYLSGGVEPDEEHCEKWVGYIMNGPKPQGYLDAAQQANQQVPANIDNPQDIPDDDIPF